MSSTNLQHSIQLLEYLSQKEYDQINALQEFCHTSDQTNLKLELDYKLHIGTTITNESASINEFLYYIGETLVAYIGISCFGGNVGEINGMTHPDWRRQGLFQRLFVLASNECRKRNYLKILLLTDGKSASGIDFIQSVGGNYEASEYRMKLDSYRKAEASNSVTLRISEKSDQKEIIRQNVIFFDDIPETEETSSKDATQYENSITSVETSLVTETVPLIEDTPNSFTYMVELSGVTIGKIKVEYGENYAFICGFGILPDYRGKGYGKAALKETLHLLQEKEIAEVELDVLCTNSNALNLYKACGFEEMSIMNYYQYPLVGYNEPL